MGQSLASRVPRFMAFASIREPMLESMIQTTDTASRRGAHVDKGADSIH